jgi:hypothetical protein
MQTTYRFRTINGNRSPRVIAQELRSKIDAVLSGTERPSSGSPGGVR